MKNLKTTFKLLVSITLTLGLITGCSDSTSSTSSSTNPNNGTDSWLIPEDEVVDGGPGKDGIPSIDDPNFTQASEVQFIPDERRIIGVKIGNTIKAYPHQVMDWHEIVNDQVGDTPVALTYCPLTGTAICWNRNVNGSVTEFGVSGLLFRNNLIPYDRNTDSRWSQMQLRSVSGELSSTNIETIDVVETTWETWKQLYPESQVLNTNTGFSRNYDGYAYGRNYSTNDSDILFPVQNSDDRLPNKERVHGVIERQPADQNVSVRAYPIKDFRQGISVVNDQLGQKNIVVAGSEEFDLAVSFETVLEDGTQLSFEAVPDDLPIIMEDQEGNRWDLFGYAIEGPRQGERLTPTHSYTGYWFGWADFFPGLEIHQSN